MSAHDAGTTSRTTKPSRAHRAGILLMLMLFALPLSMAHAQQPLPAAGDSSVQTPAPRTTAPMIAGHRFVTSASVRGPFISTYFRSGLAIGMAPGSEIPVAVIDGQEITWKTGDVLFSTLQLEYQYAVKDWMGFWMNYGLAGRLGTETASLLSQGVTVVSGFRVGWLLKLMQANDMALAGTVQITKTGYTAVDLAGFVQGIIDNGLTDDDKLVHDASLMTAGAGLSYAWAINQRTGLTASGAVSYGETPDRTAGNDWYFDVGGAVDFDLSRTIHAPIGTAIAARTNSVPESDLNLGNSTTTASFRLEYIGRPDLNLGLEFASQWDDIRDSDRTLRYTTVALDLRYYF
jgi:hypothetical protein